MVAAKDLFPRLSFLSANPNVFDRFRFFSAAEPEADQWLKASPSQTEIKHVEVIRIIS
jgi:hypothetical protein